MSKLANEQEITSLFVLVSLSIQNCVLEIITCVVLNYFGWSSAPFHTCVPLHVVFIIKVKQSRYRPGVAQRVPGS
jgi:hypothetical protein